MCYNLFVGRNIPCKFHDLPGKLNMRGRELEVPFIANAKDIAFRINVF